MILVGISTAKKIVWVRQSFTELHICTIMDNTHRVVFLQFHDVTKQNGHTSVGTLYREPLGEIVVYYDNVYKN